MTKKYPTPYLFELARQVGSYQVALDRIRFERCLYCGKELKGWKMREFCNRSCMRKFFKWRAAVSQETVGTINIRAKRKDETWEEYHEYLKSLKVW